MIEPFETEKSEALYKRAAQHLALGVSSGMRRHVTPVPLYFERANGAYFYDADGHELLDYTLGWGPLIAGNNNPHITQAVIDQLKQAYAYGAQHLKEIELAELMTDVLPGVDQVIFSNSGSEAIQAAIRIARAHTGRNKFIKFEGHYHGWFNNVLVSYHPPGTEDPCISVPACGGQPSQEYAETIVLPWNNVEVLAQAFEQYPSQIACVITEPVLANSGSCMPKDAYLQSILNLCQRHGAVSIFDEVITGFRLALGGARQYFGLTPDLSVYAKAMANGFAISSVGGRRELFDVLRDGRTIHAGTYNGNPVNMAAAIATIKVLSEPGIYDRINVHGQSIRQGLEKAASHHGIQLVTCGVGAVFNAHFGVTQAPLDYRDTLRTDLNLYSRFRAAMLQKGIQLLPDGRWYVGAAHSDKELERALESIEWSMERIAGQA